MADVTTTTNHVKLNAIERGNIVTAKYDSLSVHIGIVLLTSIFRLEHLRQLRHDVRGTSDGNGRTRGGMSLASSARTRKTA